MTSDAADAAGASGSPSGSSASDAAGSASPSSSSLAEQAPVGLLLGGALCVSCLASVGYALAAFSGIAVIPANLGFSGPTGLALSGLLLGAFGVLVVHKHRRNRETVAAGEPPDPYWSFHGPRALASLGLGFGAVAGVALLAKVAVEAMTELTYTIHWFETVPFLSLAFAWIIHGEWNRRVLAREHGGPEEADGAEERAEGGGEADAPEPGPDR